MLDSAVAYWQGVAVLLGGIWPMMNVLVDTDAGTEFDDAACLGYLASRPQCSLVGVTTTGPDPAAQAQYVRAFLARCGRDRIPVVAGARPPTLADARWRADDFESPASGFLAALMRAHARDIVLISIAPLTNIAAMVAADPAAYACLDRHIIMCGSFGEQDCVVDRRYEWNARVDPYAAAYVQNASSGVPLLIVGEDTAGTVGFLPSEASEVVRSAALLDALQAVRQLAPHRKFIRLDDVVAGVCALDPASYRAEEGQVRYVKGGDGLFRVRWSAAPGGTHHLVRSVDAARVRQEFIARTWDLGTHER